MNTPPPDMIQFPVTTNRYNPNAPRYNDVHGRYDGARPVAPEFNRDYLDAIFSGGSGWRPRAKQ